MYKSLIRPVVSYESETWVLQQKSADMLDMFERKVLRRIFGPVNEGGRWRMRRNEELRALYQEASLSTFVRLQRLRWYGHLEGWVRNDWHREYSGHSLSVPGHGEGLETDGPMQWEGIWEAQGCGPISSGKHGRGWFVEARDHWVRSARWERERFCYWEESAQHIFTYYIHPNAAQQI